MGLLLVELAVIASFVGLVLSKTEEEVKRQYAQDTVVLQKYELMKQMMREAGMIE